MTTLNEAYLIDRATYELAHHGLQQIVNDLATPPDIALARIWLLQDHGSCDICRSSTEIGHSDCSLHLAASAGQSRNGRHPEVWNRREGMSHRFPLRSQKIGRIGATGKPLIVRKAVGETALTNPEWLHREGIQSFFGYPLVAEEKLFGVLAVFSRRELVDFDIHLLRQVANGAARILSNSCQLAAVLDRSSRLSVENDVLRTNLKYQRSAQSIVANAPASLKWLGQIRLASQHRQPVLITGEHGSGKEFTAKVIHEQGPQADGPFMKMNAAALTNDLLNALTGDDRSAQRGVVNSSEKTCGTLFLDGIETIPADVQSQLTQVLLDATVSSNTPLKKHRIVLASSADLPAIVAAGRLQNELYCALSVSEIVVPSLRERLNDFEDLVREIANDICRNEQRPPFTFDSSNIVDLSHRSWPGNVRELRQAIEVSIWRSNSENLSADGCLLILPPTSGPAGKSSILRENDLKRQERSNLLACLKKCQWKVYGPDGAAETLGIKPTTLMYRMKILGIRKPAN